MFYIKSKSAFSLIEISIVIVIIGIISIAITQSSRVIKEAKLKSARSLTSSSPVNSIDRLVLWLESTSSKSFLDSEKIDGGQDGNGTISTWYNIGLRSSSNATQNDADSKKPTYIRSSINSLPAIRFDGSADYLDFNGTAIANNNYTIIIVEKRLDDRGYNFFIGSEDSSENQALHLGYRGDETLTFAQYSNDYNISIDGFSSANPNIHIARFSSSLGKNYYLNGTNQSMWDSGAPSNNLDPNQGLTSYNNAVIAKHGANSYYYGDIAEIIMFNKYLSNAERENIEEYLSKKWSIKLS